MAPGCRIAVVAPLWGPYHLLAINEADVLIFFFSESCDPETLQCQTGCREGSRHCLNTDADSLSELMVRTCIKNTWAVGWVSMGSV